MVQRVPGQNKEENHTRIGHHHPGPEAENVFVSRVERLQDCLQKVDCTCIDSPMQHRMDSNSLSLVSCRYASLYFCCAIEQNDNELLTLEIIHRYVELLDKYFGSVRIFAFGHTLH